MKKFKHPEESSVTLSILMLPSHSNFSGKIHGGYILSLIDQIAFACASKHSRNYCVTASVDTVDFIAPIEVGEMVTLRASVNYTGTTSMVVGIRVESENIKTGKVKHCNSSFVTMVAKDEKTGKPTAVPGLIVNSENEMRRFARAVRRREMNKERGKELKATDFKKAKFKKALENHNVKIKY